MLNTIKKIFYITTLITILSSSLFGQKHIFGLNYKLAKANKFEEKGDYLKARKSYVKLLKKDTNNYKTNFALGMNYHYYSTDNKEQGLKYLRKGVLNNKDSISDHIFYLGESEQFNENYENAIGYFAHAKHLVALSRKDLRINNSIISEKLMECTLAKDQNTRKKNISIVHLNTTINTENSEYTPLSLLKGRNFVYNSRRASNIGKMRDVNDYQFYEDMYVSKNEGEHKSTNSINTDTILRNIENEKFHDAVVWKSNNDSLLITYRNNKLYLSKLEGNAYSKPVELFKNTTSKEWRPHASINSKKNTIYFSSCVNMDQCNLDLFKGILHDDGSVTNIESLGDLVNTLENEDSPNYDEVNDVLFYSSKNNTIGGYDIFEAKLDSTGNIKDTHSLEMPFNSPGDDIYYMKDYKTNFGYFSSFRRGGKGDMDIYKVSLFDLNCIPYKNNKYEIALDASNSTDPFGERVIYQWNFDDNTTANGQVVKHVFNRPGKHLINLNVIDSITGRIEYNEKEIEVNIDNVNYFEIHSADTVIVNESTKLSSDYCMLKSDSIKTVDWNTGDGKELSGYDVNYIYKTPGIYCQNMTLKTTQNKLYTTAKKVIVVTKDEYEQLAKINAQRADSALKANNIAINFSNDSLGASSSNGLNSDVNFLSTLVFFDFDKSFIRKKDFDKLNKFSAYLKSHANSRVEIAASCDSRGSNSYNLNLSLKRAKSVYNYLINKGVDKSKIAGLINLGESKLSNECYDNKNCSEVQHQENRRATLTLILSK